MIPLTFHTHGHQGWRQVAGFGFARQWALQPLAMDEIRRVAQGMPVMFRQVDGRWQAVAVMGPIHGVNVYVSREGRWQAPYVPAALRVYPFCLDDQNKALALCEGAALEPLTADNKDALGPPLMPLFEEERYSETLEKTQAFLLALAQGVEAVHATLTFLDQRGLLTPWQVPESDQPPSASRIEGLYQLDERAFNALPDADWLTLRGWQALGWLYAHLDSRHHARRFKSMARRIVWPSRHAPAVADPAEEAGGLLAAMAAELDNQD